MSMLQMVGAAAGAAKQQGGQQAPNANQSMMASNQPKGVTPAQQTVMSSFAPPQGLQPDSAQPTFKDWMNERPPQKQNIPTDSAWNHLHGQTQQSKDQLNQAVQQVMQMLQQSSQSAKLMRPAKPMPQPQGF